MKLSNLGGRARLRLAFLALLGAAAFGLEGARVDKFRQLEELLPTPGPFRTASGAPGREYWQQRADHVIRVELRDGDQTIHGSETISYHNHSPDELAYLWVQIDPNIYAPESHAVRTSLAPDLEGKTSYRALGNLLERRSFDGGARITRVEDARGRALEHTIVDTMMRVDLPAPLVSGASFTFDIDWNYRVNDSKKVRGRTGFEYFEDDGNYLYEIAQWFPRMAAYTDATGWQNKQFLGSGEFTLEFGDYHVEITVPDDHVVAATGVLQNPDDVLPAHWRERLEAARASDEPLFIVTPEEAEANEASTPTGKKTWVFDAFDVRDFAFASSRKFIWDAAGYTTREGERVLAMSYWPKEGEPLWSQYSTHSILHTLDVYGKFLFPYPYPVAISVNGPVGGMEYPMICFNGPRPEDDGTYSKRTKYGLISVIIHEVGHNWFPMIVNSDERQWTWMDEGLNTFVQFLAEQEWEQDYPSWRGEPKNIVGFMRDPKQVPIMTNSESLLQFGNNAYAKPATALNVLRETVLGRELFDFAFQQYAQRWRFKRPMPADLFRTLEDASAVDLDWFWNGWFYTTEHCDLALTGVRRFRVDPGDPDVSKGLARAEREAEPTTLTQARNADLARRVEAYPALLDFYNDYDELDVTDADREKFTKLLDGLEGEQRELMALDASLYVIRVENRGGLVMPVILELVHEDGSTEERRIPAEVWRRSADAIETLVVTDKTVERVVLDPHLETADTDLSNNHFPPKLEEETFQLEKGRGRGAGGKNPMQKARAAEQETEDPEPGPEGQG